jgi:hypothetical protein
MTQVKSDPRHPALVAKNEGPLNDVLPRREASAAGRKRLERMAWITAALCIPLLCLYFYYVPFNSDDGWYAYNAYAWSAGGDPAENNPDANTTITSDRPVAKFGWENRTNLTVVIQRLALALVPPDWLGLHILGFAQIIILIAASALLVYRTTRDRVYIAFVCALLLSDTSVIAAGATGARPDLFIAIFVVAIVATYLRVTESSNQLRLIGLFVLVAALPLLHATSAVAIAFLVAFVWSMQVLPQLQGRSSSPLILPASVTLVLAIFFLFRETINNLIIPTQVPHAMEQLYRHDLMAKLLGVIHNGAVHKIVTEWGRFRGYFGIGNLAHFAVIVAGGVTTIFSLRRRGLTTDLVIPSAMYVALVIAAVAMIAGDPHGTSGHILPLAVLGYVAAASSFWAVEGSFRIGSLGLTTCLSILLGAILALKIGNVAALISHLPREGISNAAYASKLPSILRGQATIVGPTEIWPYLTDPGQRILILDRMRSALPASVNEGDLAKSSALVINEDYAGYGWKDLIEKWAKEGLVSPLAKLGDCGHTRWCLEAYAIHHDKP